MRIKQFGGGTVTVLLLSALLAISGQISAADPDFDDDDGVQVEEVTDAPEVADTEEEVAYESPQYDPKDFYFIDHFDNVVESSKRWIKSRAKKDDIAEEIAKYDGIWEWEPPARIVWKQDIGLVLKSRAKHAAIAAPLSKTFTFKDEKPLIVQYEVTMQDGQECGGAYLKLLTEGKNLSDLTKFNDKTPYTIMFGPDKCGNDIKMHFIFRHINPINGSIEEKHAKKPKDRLEEPFKDKLPHLYTLQVNPDNTFEIRVDHKVINSGSLLTDFTPPVNPPREIDDPEDKKPLDWDEREKIPDPTAHKPEDWDDDAPPQIPDPTAVKPEGWLDDEPEMIPDPTAIKPDDWDNEIDGTWEAPLVDNPICEKSVGCGLWKAPLIQNAKYKGKWRAPLIENPNYQGKWAARKILNPDYFEDLTPFKMTPIGAIGIELWAISNNILFDNLIITDDAEVAKNFAAKTFDQKRKYIDKESKTFWHRLMRRMNYKPGWWALYFLYLLIPASCYVYYLYRRAKEETFMSKIVTYATENPWSWKIAIVLIGAPLAFSLYRVFSSGSAKETVNEADAKKTDAEQKDDEAGDASNISQKSSHKPKKSDLDVKDEDIATPAAGNGASGSDEKSDSEGVGGEEEEEAEAAEQTEDATAKAAGPRKRRVRKDDLS